MQQYVGIAIYCNIFYCNTIQYDGSCIAMQSYIVNLLYFFKRFIIFMVFTACDAHCIHSLSDAKYCNISTSNMQYGIYPYCCIPNSNV